MKKIAVIGLLIVLGGCQTSTQTSTSNDNQQQASAIQSECAIYYAVNAARVDAGEPVIARLTQGCPAGTDSIAADIDARPGAEIGTRLADTVRRRMIARGMPVTTASAVATSTAFETLVIEIASI